MFYMTKQSLREREIATVVACKEHPELLAMTVSS